MNPAKPSEKLSCLFLGVEQFLSKLALGGLQEASQCFESAPSVVHTPREISDYNSRNCAVTLALLRFVTVLLNKHPKEAFGVGLIMGVLAPMYKAEQIGMCNVNENNAGD